jgi:hypothetical protein
VDWSSDKPVIPIAASNTGVLALNPPVRLEATPSLWTREGQSVTPPFAAGAYFTPSFSHDGKRIAFALRTVGSSSQDMWVFDLNGSALFRLTTHASWSAFPLWTADDRSIYFVQTVGQKVNERFLFRQQIDRPDSGVRVGPSMTLTSPCSLTSDGRLLLFAHVIERSGPIAPLSLSAMPLDAPHNVRPILENDGRVAFAQLSPDDRFFVFASAVNGQNDIYIQTFVASEVRRWRVSTHGGTQPRWSRDGREIFYLSADGRFVALPVKIKTDGVELGPEKTLFTHPPLLPTYSAYQYDVSPKSDRFVFLSSASGRSTPPLRLIVNWESIVSR